MEDHKGYVLQVKNNCRHNGINVYIDLKQL
jgi:hypothetical protein